MRNNERVVDPVEYALFWVFVCCPLWKVALLGIPCCSPLPLRFATSLAFPSRPILVLPLPLFFQDDRCCRPAHKIHAGSTDPISSHKLPFHVGCKANWDAFPHIALVLFRRDGLLCRAANRLREIVSYSKLRVAYTISFSVQYGIHHPAPRSQGASPPHVSLVRKSICCFWYYDSVVVDSS